MIHHPIKEASPDVAMGRLPGVAWLPGFKPFPKHQEMTFPLFYTSQELVKIDTHLRCFRRSKCTNNEKWIENFLSMKFK